MKLKIYFIGGFIISCDISEKAKDSLNSWFINDKDSTFTLIDDNIERVLNRNGIALIEYINL